MTARWVVTAAQMREIEADAVAAGRTWEELMDRAGAQVARLAMEWLGGSSSQRVLVLAGPGNNGGDALVAARRLGEHGWPVQVLTWNRNQQGDERLREPVKTLGIPVSAITVAGDVLAGALDSCTVVLDGLLGTGLERAVTGDLAGIISMVSESGKAVIAIDLPTGISSDTGKVLGTALIADLTIALGLLKVGHVQEPGRSMSGRIVIGDIGLNAENSGAAAAQQLDDRYVSSLLPERPADANKGTFGKAMIVAGSINYVGAAALATEGAMRTGAGLVTLACAGDLLGLITPRLVECTFLPLPADMGAIAPHAAERIRSSIQGYSALLVGCGLGTDRQTSQFLHNLFVEAHSAPSVSARSIGFGLRRDEAVEEPKPPVALPPLVLDGDALNILAEWPEWAEHVPQGTILTPHPGEMARLLSIEIEDVQKDRLRTAREAAAGWKQIVVLKGAGTIIAEPGGRVMISPFSNSALATAGTGDVLAGAIAGLLAQGLAPFDAACAGVFLHGAAGELLRQEFGLAGGLAGDLPVLLARAQRSLREA